jgi:cell wall-associated NlpC family hydrolase
MLPDPRRHPYRGDLAAEALRGVIKAERYVKGEARQVSAPSLPVRREPRFDATLDTEALLGETVTLYDESEGWAWVQLTRDSYVGYMPSEGLTRTVTAPTHRVAALRTYIYPEPDGKSPAVTLLSLNALVTVSGEEGKFLALAGGGYVFARHASPIGETAPDLVAVAESFLGTPYLWGGRTSIGLDCSGLVQLAVEAAGLSAPRDADMQAAELGHPIDWREGAKLRRGDLVFWEGHVGIMTSPTDLLHANAHHMAVEVEPLSQARHRIKAAGYEVTGVRRLPGAR